MICRTLEYLTRHLHRVSLSHQSTGMTAKNVAIVWAPNLLRCKSLEVGGVAALQGVGVQAVVTEYLIKYCELIFSEKLAQFTPVLAAAEATSTPKLQGKNRPKSLAISTPTKLVSLEEARSRALTACNNLENQKYIEVGGGPENLPQKYHTVIELPGKKGGSFKHKKSTAWKSIFSGKERKKSVVAGERKISTPSELHLLSSGTLGPSVLSQPPPALRPVRSAESLVPGLETGTSGASGSPGIPANPVNTEQSLLEPVETPQSGHSELDMLAPLETVTRAVTRAASDYRRDSPKCHSRSSSHDSYFERKLAVQFKADLEAEAEEVSEEVEKDPACSSPRMKIDSSLDISEIQMNFELEDNEMKIFSEDEAMMSTSVGSELSLPRSPLEEVVAAPSPAPLPVTRGSNQRTDSPLESPTKSRRLSFKEKFKKFTSPTMSRKHSSEASKMVDSGVGFDSDSCSGSFENKSFEEGKKSSKLKEKIVSALSPESLRRRSESRENSSKKKKSSVSPGASPNIGSLIKRSKIEEDISEMSSINLSPSIKFIDASSSYELGLGVSNETLEDSLTPRADDEHWNEGTETVRENIQKEEDDAHMHSSIIEAEIHELSEEKAEGEDLVGPISIIGATLDVEEEDEVAEENKVVEEDEDEDEETTESHTNNPATDQPAVVEDENLPEEIFSLDSRTSEEVASSLSSKEESELSVSYAGATVSENESFGVETSSPLSTNDEAADDTCNPIERDDVKVSRLECEETLTSLAAERERDDDSQNFAMEIEEDKNRPLNKQKDDDQVENEQQLSSEDFPMETDLTIMSAEIPTNNPLYVKNDNKTVFNDIHFGNFNYESDSEDSDSSESPIESNTSERSECPREIETSNQTSAQSSPSEQPHFLLELEGESSLQAQQSEEKLSKLRLDLSPPLENVLMRRSPSSPARNRSVRSDFLSNFVVEPQEPQGPQEPQDGDIGRPPLPKTSPPKFTGIAKALSPQPYNKPINFDAQTKLSTRNKFSSRPSDTTVFITENPVSPLSRIESVGRSVPQAPAISQEINSIMEEKTIDRREDSLDMESNEEQSLMEVKTLLGVEERPDMLEMTEEQSLMEEKTLGGVEGPPAMFERTEEHSLMEEKMLDVSPRSPVVERPDSLSPEPEAECDDGRCLSLEPEVRRDLMMSPVESGRRSTQGIPEVRTDHCSHWVVQLFLLQVERNVKFSQADIRTPGKKSAKPGQTGTGEVGVTKNRSKSSTLSLHAVAAAREQEEEPPLLQRRNSIHNVPFVDVNDPDTRTRMERYKEERRSMLRAKYKAEDYLSSTFARKKKVSGTSSCDGDGSSVSVTATKSISVSPPDSPSFRKMSTPDSPQSPNTSKISLKKIDLKKTQQMPTRPSLEEETGMKTPEAVIYKTQVITSVKKPFVPPVQSRPDDLAISSFTKSGDNNSQSVSTTRLVITGRGSPSPPAPAEEIVNVKERASIFGPRKFSESKVRTVSAPVAEAKSFNNKTSSANINITNLSQTSPSKIKNMAALFEQKN